MAIQPIQAIAWEVVGLALLGLAGGCAGVSTIDRHESVAHHPATPRELVLICRPNVLQMQDGSRVPGIVAQAFVMGGDSKGPVSVPAGSFRFAAMKNSTARTSDAQPVQTWTFPADETPRHMIEHSLGSCYAFWLPCQPSETAIRPLTVQAFFECDGREIQSSTVKVAVPGT